MSIKFSTARTIISRAVLLLLCSFSGGLLSVRLEPSEEYLEALMNGTLDVAPMWKYIQDSPVIDASLKPLLAISLSKDINSSNQFEAFAAACRGVLEHGFDEIISAIVFATKGRMCPEKIKAKFNSKCRSSMLSTALVMFCSLGFKASLLGSPLSVLTAGLLGSHFVEDKIYESSKFEFTKVFTEIVSDILEENSTEWQLFFVFIYAVLMEKSDELVNFRHKDISIFKVAEAILYGRMRAHGVTLAQLQRLADKVCAEPPRTEAIATVPVAATAASRVNPA